MLNILRKYKYVFIIVLVLVISTLVFVYKYNKQTNHNTLSFEVTQNATSSPQQYAAVLLLAPSSGQFLVGDIVNVTMLVNAPNLPINSVESTVTFPTDKLEITSISKESSIFSLWIQEPSFSNKDGLVTFIGGLPAPGFIGLAGNIFTMSFRVKEEGHAVVNITNAQVLANDGLGTNILDKTIPAELALLKPKVKKNIADINGDGKVNLADFSILISNFGKLNNVTNDLNGDGIVNTIDVSIILSKWTK
ncbi:MAG: cohesin domain-containing protein [bacterium]